MYVHAALDKFLEELDSRHMETQQLDSKKFVPQRNKRVPGPPLSTVPPFGFPAWAVSKDWLKCKYIHFVNSVSIVLCY